MGEDKREPDTLVGALVNVVTVQRDKYFLFASGGGILLAMVALAGPEGGQVYAGILAALFVVFAVLRAMLESQKVRATAAGRGPAAGSTPNPREGNVAELGDRARVDGLEQEADGGANVFRGGGRSRARNVQQSTGPVKRKRR